MYTDVEKLYRLSAKPSRIIIGLMSGTSVDGLDVALCKVSGSGLTTRLELLQFETVVFEEEIKKEIISVFSKKQVDLQKLTLLNPWIALKHGAIINDLLKKWQISNDTVDLVASHGQTIYHAPKSLHRQQKFGNATLQIGDGDHLAMATGIITISDFRQKHIAAGGEGAPLALFGDLLLFSKAGEDRLLLNIGGIANFTFLPGDMTKEKILCTDTGPGNTLMDAYMQRHFPGKYYDEDAAIARQGHVHEGLLNTLKAHSFFSIPFPKTTGPELFNISYIADARERAAADGISVVDTMATLNRFTAETIADALRSSVKNINGLKIFSSGGGMHNPLVMEHLQTLLPGAVFGDTKLLGIDPDAKEAVLFAVLANECIAGDGVYTDGLINVSMGKISFPS